MALSDPQRELRDAFLAKMLVLVVSLKGGPDPEVTLEALVESSQMLTEHLLQELAELRQEQAE